MNTSIFLAQLMGLFALVMGASMLIRRKMLMSVFHEISSSRALSYILGVLIFLLGLLVVLSHNLWELKPPLLITLIGWGILIEGASYLFVSKESLRKYLAILDNRKVYYLIAGGYLILGSYLVYLGFWGAPLNPFVVKETAAYEHQRAPVIEEGSKPATDNTTDSAVKGEQTSREMPGHQVKSPSAPTINDKTSTGTSLPRSQQVPDTNTTDKAPDSLKGEIGTDPTKADDSSGTPTEEAKIDTSSTTTIQEAQSKSAADTGTRGRAPLPYFLVIVGLATVGVFVVVVRKRPGFFANVFRNMGMNTGTSGRTGSTTVGAGTCGTPVFCERCNFGGDPCGKLKGHPGEHTSVPFHTCRQGSRPCSGCDKYFSCTQACGHEGEHRIPGHPCRFKSTCPGVCQEDFPCTSQCGHEGAHTRRPHRCPGKCPRCDKFCGSLCAHAGLHDFGVHPCPAAKYPCHRCGKIIAICLKQCGHEGNHDTGSHRCLCGATYPCHYCGKPLICTEDFGHELDRTGHGGTIPPHGPCLHVEPCPQCGDPMRCVKDCHGSFEHAFRHVCGAAFT